MADHDEIWISAAEALRRKACDFAAEMKIDALTSREEAMNAIIGDLACGYLRSIPRSYLASSLEKVTMSDYRFYEIDRDGRYSDTDIDLEYGTGQPIIPVEFWLMFRDPSVGASANWQDGHFSFSRTDFSGASLSGSVRDLCIRWAGIPSVADVSGASPVIISTDGAVDTADEINTRTLSRIDRVEFEPASSLRRRRGRGRRPNIDKEFYMALHRQRYEQGEASPIKTEEAEFLRQACEKKYPGEKISAESAIENWLCKEGYGKIEKSQ